MKSRALRARKVSHPLYNETETTWDWTQSGAMNLALLMKRAEEADRSDWRWMWTLLGLSIAGGLGILLELMVSRSS